MIDWNVARQLAGFVAGDSAQEPTTRLDLDPRVTRARTHVEEYASLHPEHELPAPEAIDRREWADINLDAFARMLEPVSERLEEQMAKAGPFSGPLRMIAGGAVGAEAGLVTGYVSQRILGQYELSLLDAEVPPRLLFVAPNLEKAIRELGVERESFLDWIALHEITHALQFSSVPWLRDHMGGVMREYLATVEVKIGEGGGFRLPSLPDPQDLIERFKEGGLAALVQSPEQQEIFNRIQAAMAVIEGYSEHVMDAVGENVLSGYAGLRDAMERRRKSRSAPERLLQRLLGLEMKMRQYEVGKRFCDQVVERAGIEGLNVVWRSAEDLPSLAELDDAAGWVARVGAAAPTPAAASAEPE